MCVSRHYFGDFLVRYFEGYEGRVGGGAFTPHALGGDWVGALGGWLRSELAVVDRHLALHPGVNIFIVGLIVFS